jgi:cbb3-type cytochrome oxidase maturation protein
MSVLFVVLPLALLVSACAVVAFVWASESGQLDDLATPAHRALEEDDSVPAQLPSGEAVQQLDQRAP